MLARIVNYIWPTNRGHEPNVPIKNLADEFSGQDTYSMLANYWAGAETPETTYPTQDPTRQFFVAVEKGDFVAVKDFIENKCFPVDATQLEARSIRTPLMEALRQKNWDMARYLIDHGADVNFQHRGDYETTYRYSPLMTVVNCLKDHRNIALPLLKYMVEEKGGNLDATNAFGSTTLHNAIQRDDRELFDYCLSRDVNIQQVPKGNIGSWTPCTSALYEATMHGRLEMAETLLKCGAHVEGKNKQGNSTPLSNAAYQEKSRVTMMELLIHYGANVNFQGHNGATPLLNAVRSGRVDHARLLLEHGADWTIKDWMHHESAESELARIAKRKASASIYPKTLISEEEYPIAEMQALFKEFKDQRETALRSVDNCYSSNSTSSDSNQENHEPAVNLPRP